MANKDFKTIKEQLEILRSRGLTINDENKAQDFLLCNNYYRISGYSLTLRKNDIFSKLAYNTYDFSHEPVSAQYCGRSEARGFWASGFSIYR